MISRLIYSLKYLRYIFFAKHKKGHGIHSPFLFNLIKNVFNNKRIPEELKRVIALHKKLKKSKDKIEFNEIGAGSKYRNGHKISIGKLVKRSSVSEKYGILLYQLIQYFNIKDIIEIGSSVGVSSLYLGQANKKSHFKSIEGVDEKINIAIKNAKTLNLQTEFILGDFNTILNDVVNSFDKLDLVFFDGNHTKESTLNYFNICLQKAHNNTIFIFDDIHWSREMEKAWNEIKKNKKVRLCIDIFRMGLIFFKKELSYEKYVIKF